MRVEETEQCSIAKGYPAGATSYCRLVGMSLVGVILNIKEGQLFATPVLHQLRTPVRP